jgi:hypothetical protein
MSTELIKYYNETTLFMVLASVSLMTTIYLCFLKMPRPPLLDEDDEPTFSQIGLD